MLIRDYEFVKYMIRNELNVLNSFKGFVQNFLRNYKAPEHRELLKKMMSFLGELGDNVGFPLHICISAYSVIH